MGYSKDAIKGVLWTAGLRGTTRLMSLARTMVLARILVPAQFGIIGIANLVLAFLEILTETGINIFLVQEKENVDDFLDTAWIISILRGIIIFLLILLSAPFVADFFHSEGATLILVLISLVPLIRGFINPSIVKFQKDLDFNKEFWFRSSIFFIDSVIAIGLSLMTRSVLSIVAGLIAAALFEVLTSFLIVKPVPVFNFNKEQFKRIANRGKWLTGAGVFNYLFQHGDDIVVGRLLGEAPLGIYSVTYKISSLPITEIADVFSKVTFPVYTKIVDDKKRLKVAFFKTLVGISVLVFLLSSLIYIFAQEIILILLGNNWVSGVPVLRILAVYGGLKAISSTTYPLFLALKKQEYVTVITFIGLVGLGISIIPLVVKYGLNGAGISAIIGSFASVPVAIYFLSKVFKEKSNGSSRAREN